jgi:hypothetical protein
MRCVRPCLAGPWGGNGLRTAAPCPASPGEMWRCLEQPPTRTSERWRACTHLDSLPGAAPLESDALRYQSPGRRMPASTALRSNPSAALSDKTIRLTTGTRRPVVHRDWPVKCVQTSTRAGG